MPVTLHGATSGNTHETPSLYDNRDISYIKKNDRNILSGSETIKQKYNKFVTKYIHEEMQNILSSFLSANLQNDEKNDFVL